VGDEPARPGHTIENPEAYVIERMQAGADEEAIVAGLEERGMQRADARHVVDTVYPQVMRAAEAEVFSSSAPAPAVVVAVVAAILGGIAWGLIVVTTDYEIGFAALGIGVLCGYAVVLATRGRRGRPLQVIAVASAALGIILGKYFTYYYLVKEAVRDAGGEEAADEVSVFDTELVRFFFEDLESVFSVYDVLWIAFAVYAAWRIPRGMGIPVRRTELGRS
jgi:hypothetical protein